MIAIESLFFIMFQVSQGPADCIESVFSTQCFVSVCIDMYLHVFACIGMDKKEH